MGRQRKSGATTIASLQGLKKPPVRHKPRKGPRCSRSTNKSSLLSHSRRNGVSQSVPLPSIHFLFLSPALTSISEISAHRAMGQRLSVCKLRVRARTRRVRKYADRQVYNANKTPDGHELSSVLRPMYATLIRDDLGYEGPLVPKDGAAEALLDFMLQKAMKTGIPLTADDPLSSKGFRLGFSFGVLAYPDHPIEVKSYIGLFSWIVVQIDDKTPAMRDDVSSFQKRFISGEPQPNPLLQGLADLLHEAYDHWEPLMANLLVTSALNFMTSNALDTRDEFKTMRVTPAGVMFPYYFRDLAGITEAYAIFAFPRARYPDIGCFLEAIPDMALFINIANDVISFYKEELAGETRNYVHNRALCERKPPMQVLEEVKVEVVECWQRINSILDGRAEYAQAWLDHARGHISMHTTNPRYRLSELGLGEKHPLDGLWDPLEEALGKNRKSNSSETS